MSSRGTKHVITRHLAPSGAAGSSLAREGQVQSPIQFLPAAPAGRSRVQSLVIYPNRNSTKPSVAASPPRRRVIPSSFPLPKPELSMELGAFSVSLAVKDLEASQAVLREVRLQGLRRRCRAELADPEERRPRHRPVPGHVRQEHPHLQPRLGPERPARSPRSPTCANCSASSRPQGVQLMTEADETTTGPASFIAVDPDGNPILVDQHV